MSEKGELIFFVLFFLFYVFCFFFLFLLTLDFKQQTREKKEKKKVVVNVGKRNHALVYREKHKFVIDVREIFVLIVIQLVS